MQIIRSLPISSLMPRTRLINVADYALVLALPDDVHVAVPNAENKTDVPARHSPQSSGGRKRRVESMYLL